MCEVMLIASRKRDDEMKNTTEEVVQVTLRCPPYLKARLDQEATLNRSSQSSELIRLMRAAWPESEREKVAV